MRQLEERYLERLSQFTGDTESAKGHRAFSDRHSWGI